MKPPSLVETYEQMIREQMPNFLRLYLSPSVTQTCFCLSRYVRDTWYAGPLASAVEFQSFLANSFDEALSGAIKLARYAASKTQRPTAGLVVDPAGRLGPYAGVKLVGDKWVEFIPGLTVIGDGVSISKALEATQSVGLVVLVAGAEAAIEPSARAIRQLIDRDRPIVITCVDRPSLAVLRSGPGRLLRSLSPDIVVFDESFVDHAVPFSAFASRKTLYNYWNRRGRATFHSTTYQPNTISSLHFVRCLPAADPEFYRSVASSLEEIIRDVGLRRTLFRKLYSPSLYRAIRTTGFDTPAIRACGSYVFAGGRRVFDGVSGVACSVRGHNPSTYAVEMDELAKFPAHSTCITPKETAGAVRAELADRLSNLTGLDQVLPAVSGATAVESALKVALVAQFPKRHVLALRAGFGGKTLLALTGTANFKYKEHIEPLYPDVYYLDPFSPDAEVEIERMLKKQPVAVVQVELIQAVGGVRKVPERVIHILAELRRKYGYLLLVDEVQTGMFRTGPFTLSGAMNLMPDLLTLGKGTSDMMFPFGLVLYSAAVQEKLARANADLAQALSKRYGYELGYLTVLNVLRRAEELNLPRRVAESGEMFARLLEKSLADCPAVREVRTYGLLIGIELECGGGSPSCQQADWPLLSDNSRGIWGVQKLVRRLLRKRLFWPYLSSILRHPRYPVLMGYCQYEPNVLKLTPPLTVAEDEIRDVCGTIVEELRRPLYRHLFRLLGHRRKYHEYARIPAAEPVAP